jgi:branched-chain amino acid transport system permease protein
LVIPATAAAVIGGLSSMTGAFFGGLVGGFCESLLTGVPQLASIRSAAPYLIALVFIAVFSRASQGARL